MSGAKRSRSNGTPRTGTRGFGKKNLHGPWKSKLSAKQKTLVQEKLVGHLNRGVTGTRGMALQTFDNRLANIVVDEVNRTPCLHCKGACVNKAHRGAICTVEDVNAAYASYMEPAAEAEAHRVQAAIEKAREKARAKAQKAAFRVIAKRNELLAKKAARHRKCAERRVRNAGKSWISEVNESNILGSS